MTDPRDFDRKLDRQMEMDARTGTPTPWGWIAGALFIIGVLVLVFSTGNNTRIASNETVPPATTGMAPGGTAPLTTEPPIVCAPFCGTISRSVPPAQAPSTTGQGR